MTAPGNLNMTQEKLLELVNIVLTNSGRPAVSDLPPETRLKEDLGMDSFELAELTIRVEEITGVDVFEDEVINTVEEVMRKVS